MSKSVSSLEEKGVVMVWQKIRTGFMFGVAVIASPCCAPLIVPLALALLAGTPAAAWMSYNIGWVYGGLTLISVASLVLGFHWLRQKKSAKNISLVIPSKTSPTVSLTQQTVNRR